MVSRRIQLVGILVLLLVLVAGCGGQTAPDVDATVAAAVAETAAAQTENPPAATSVPAATAAPTKAPEQVSMAITSLDDLQKAVIQIEAQGTFVDPEEGVQYDTAGRGSGFIIDEEGHAVTNNHVVTGAALLKVWVGGESTPRNAKILGVSECSDMAVIDIEGSGYPYLEWYGSAVRPGLDVYAAGFPLGDPEFTLTRGIVSKAHADGETDWASIDSVIEHDATINPGNSGGPLVTADGKVVGINYAGADDANQYFAIARGEALPIIAKLLQDQDVDTIGINGTALLDGDLSGIWVSSVQSGSPADEAGVKAGDLIVALEGLSLGTDGTMADYCDVLRTHDPDDTLSLEVVRTSTEEYLEGQLNGRPLEPSFSFAQTLGDDVNPSPSGSGGSAPAAYEYVTLVDDENAIQFEVPTAWDDTDGSTWLFDDQLVGSALSASPNYDEFLSTYGTPGVFFGASAVLTQRFTVDSLLDRFKGNNNELDCTYEGRDSYEDALYTGQYDYYSDCGDVKSTIIDLVAEPEDQSFLMWLNIQVVDDADLDALDHLLNSFQVIGELPSDDGSSAVTPQPSDDEIDPDWIPPAGQASVVLVNDAAEDIVVAIAGQEFDVASAGQLVITLDPGVYDYTATDPRFDPYDSTCEVEADSVYYWYSDDSDWGSCEPIWP
ncbi:MAG: trypsin-like peptidase domain-containing protein [Caldilineae bacterium]|nr:trypsin-like peptidase domain-containing protein [Anaerolineae bacterium]MCB9155219.1 trypsin-like peptidase domain-containing protein [Caldilineae bacterium]